MDHQGAFAYASRKSYSISDTENLFSSYKRASSLDVLFFVVPVECSSLPLLLVLIFLSKGVSVIVKCCPTFTS